MVVLANSEMHGLVRLRKSLSTQEIFGDKPKLASLFFFFFFSAATPESVSLVIGLIRKGYANAGMR